MRYIVYTIYYILYTIYYILYTVHCILYKAQAISTAKIDQSISRRRMKRKPRGLPKYTQFPK